MVAARACDLLGAPLSILILSPQPWLGLQVSKHHYARELAALGHRIHFLEPPGNADAVILGPSDVDGVTLVNHPPMPLSRFKYRARWLFDRAARHRAATIAAAVGPIDLLWDFDNARQFADHRAFGAAASILHVVDRLIDGDNRHRHADLIVGVDASLVADIATAGRPRLVVGHGLSPLFAETAMRRLAIGKRRDSGAPVTIGFIGNLAQPAMDRTRVTALVAVHREVAFRFIGPVLGETPEIAAWVERLRGAANVSLPGLLTGAALIDAVADVDIWLLCYDPLRDRNRGVNSHKLLEYFALGGEIVSSPITAQSDAPGIFMAPQNDPDAIFALLDAAIVAVREGRDTGWQRRIELALASSYRANVDCISAHLTAALVTAPKDEKL